MLQSGDHGPWNSWDRIPYITDVFDTEPDTLPPLKPKGKASVVPAWRHIRHNFIMSVYSSQEAIDTDDGSAYYQTYEVRPTNDVLPSLPSPPLLRR